MPVEKIGDRRVGTHPILVGEPTGAAWVITPRGGRGVTLVLLNRLLEERQRTLELFVYPALN